MTLTKAQLKALEAWRNAPDYFLSMDEIPLPFIVGLAMRGYVEADELRGIEGYILTDVGTAALGIEPTTTFEALGSKNEIATPQQIAMGEPIDTNPPSREALAGLFQRMSERDNQAENTPTTRQMIVAEYLALPEPRPAVICEKEHIAAIEDWRNMGNGLLHCQLPFEPYFIVVPSELTVMLAPPTAPIALTLRGTPNVSLVQINAVLARYGLQITREYGSSVHAESED